MMGFSIAFIIIKILPLVKCISCNLNGISFIGFGFFFLSENHLTLPLFAPILRVISYNEPKGGMGSADL